MEEKADIGNIVWNAAEACGSQSVVLEPPGGQGWVSVAQQQNGYLVSSFLNVLTVV